MVAPLVHIKKLTYPFFFYWFMAPHLTPADSDMGQKAFTVEIFITKFQPESGLEPCSNVQVKYWEAEIPLSSIRNLGYELDPSCSLMHNIA